MRITGSASGSRPRALAVAALVAACVATACGGAAPAAEPTQSTVAKATIAPATSAPVATASATAAKTVVNVEAGETADGHIYMKADRLGVPAGPVTFTFTNKGKLTHEIMVYPVQDITKVLAAHRNDQDVDEMELIKGMAAMHEDVDPGATVTETGTLKAGFYEIACHVSGKNPNGSTFTHFDKGQFVTLAAIGAGGPGASVTEAAPTMAIDMKGDEGGSWLFVPDRLAVTAGEVTFKVTNGMKMEHDFVVSPVGDTSMYVKMSLMPGMSHNDDYSSFGGTELIEDLASGKTESVTLKLTPGLYVAACYMTSTDPDGNVFMHRDRGQRIVFQVK